MANKKPFLGINMQADDFSEWRLVWMLQGTVWVLKQFGFDPDFKKLGERLAHAWRVIRRPLFIVLLSPPVIKWVLPWLVWQVTRWEWSPSLSYKTMFTVGVVAAALSWAWSYEANVQDELDLTAETVVRSVFAASGKIDEDIKIDYMKANHDGSMVVEFKPGLPVQQYGDLIAEDITIAAEDSVRASWIPGSRPDTIRVTTHVDDLPTLVLPDMDQIGKPGAEDLVWLGVDEESKPLHWDTSHAVHLMVTGETGGGKGVLSRLILVHARMHGWEVSVIDPKGGADYSWCKRAGISVKEYRGSHFDLHDMCAELRYAVSEMQRRNDKINAHNDRVIETGQGKEVENWRQYTAEVDPEALRMLILFDEAKAFRDLFLIAEGDQKEELKELFAEAVVNIQRLTSLGRSAGFHLVVMTQRGDTDSLGGKVVGAAIRNNLPGRIVCGMADPSSMKLGLGIDEKLDIGGLETAGRCKYRRLVPGPARVHTGQVGFIRAGEVLTEWPNLVPKQRTA